MLRLVADDLTGALDSAAPFATAAAAIPVIWDERAWHATRGACAVDSGTRDLDGATAARRVAALADGLLAGAPAFKKIDSRLRGHPAEEIAALWHGGGFRTAVLAPAFPAQGRISRGGRQLVHGGDRGWEDCGVDLPARLEGLGVATARGAAPGEQGVIWCDAVDDRDLQAIAARAPALPTPILWCGSAGLAHALAGTIAPLDPAAVLRPPVVVLLGSPHPVTMAQADALARILGRAVELHRPGLPERADPVVASAALDRLIDRLAGGPPPGALVVAGGDTLARLARAAGASHLEVIGAITPGVPVSRVVGGRWEGVPLISKSGGFGAPGFLRDLLAGVVAGHA